MITLCQCQIVETHFLNGPVRALICFSQFGQCLLDYCDVSANPNDAASRVSTFRDQNPPTVWQQALERALIAVMPFQRLANKLFDIVTGLRILPDLCSLSNNVLKPRPGVDEWSTERINLAEPMVAGEQSVLLVPHDEAIRHRLDCTVQQIARLLALCLHPLALAERGIQGAGKREYQQTSHGEDDEQAIPVPDPVC